MKTATTVVGLCLAVALGVLAPATAGAAPPTAPPGNAVVGSGLVPVYDPDTDTSAMVEPDVAARIITAYWTPERIAAAEPVSADAGTDVPDTRPEGTPRVIAEPTRTSTTLPGTAQPAGVAFTNAMGKIFFHDPTDPKNVNRACSGSAINTPKRRIVLTAGHCVNHGPGGTWAQNWAFQPGFQFGTGAPGIFPAFQLWAQSGWINSADHHFDYAFAVTHINGNGKRLVDTVPGNGLIINPGRPFVTYVGYPSNVSNGQQQASCQGQLSRRSITNSDQEFPCNLGPGSSGGPMVLNFSNAIGVGFAVSDVSYSLSPAPLGPVFGPYYDSDTANLLNAAENSSP